MASLVKPFGALPVHRSGRPSADLATLHGAMALLDGEGMGKEIRVLVQAKGIDPAEVLSLAVLGSRPLSPGCPSGAAGVQFALKVLRPEDEDTLRPPMIGPPPPVNRLPLSAIDAPLAVGVSPLPANEPPPPVSVSPLAVSVSPLAAGVSPLAANVSPLSFGVSPRAFGVSPLPAGGPPRAFGVSPLPANGPLLPADAAPLPAAGPPLPAGEPWLAAEGSPLPARGPHPPAEGLRLLARSPPPPPAVTRRPNGPGDPSPGLRRRPMPWGEKNTLSCGLKDRENLLRSCGCQTSGQQSRSLSGRTALSISPPRASAYDLSPGLRSPGPLGRTGRPVASYQFDCAVAI